MIQFTLGEAWAVILSICGGIVTIAAAISVALKIIAHFRRPNLKQDEEIEKLWKEVEKMKEENSTMNEKFLSFFDSDKKRLDAIEDGNRVTQHALLALLSHGLDGNDTDSLKKAKKDMEEYLIAR